MPIIFVETQYPASKNKEVLAAWMKALEKYPRDEGLTTPLVESAVTSDMCGLRVLSASQTKPGKYEEAIAYTGKFMSEFFDIEGFYYEIRTWMTIDEAMESIGEKAPDR
jgi:hypothetical protein